MNGNTRLFFGAATLLAGILAPVASAEIVTQRLEYRDGDVTLRGVLVYEDAVQGKAPGVLVVHEWWGLNDFAKTRARRLAEQGYVALAVDMYGDGRTTTDPKEAGQWASELRGDVPALRRRITAALDALRAQDSVDPQRIGAIGFCFGGTVVLQLAYSGAEVRGVVSLHGGLVAPTAEEVRAINSAILILHGAADPHVPMEQVNSVMQALQSSSIDWQVDIYGGAQHGFTNPQVAGETPGAAYDPQAAARAINATDHFLTEVLRGRD